MARVQRIMRNWLPPVISAALKRLAKRNIHFEGNYKSWEEAALLTDGYAHEEIVEEVLSSILKVKAGEAAFERDSVLFDEIVYSWPVTAGLLLGAARSNGRLEVLDYGGALGSHYFQNRKILGTLDDLSWNVVEQPHYVAAGQRHLEDDILHFYPELDDCVEKARPNVILASSVLQYLPRPMEALAALAAIGADVLVLDRTPYLKDESAGIIKIQIVPESIYKASYPCWFLQEKQIVRTVEKAGYRTLEAFQSLDRLDDAAEWKGHLFCKVI